MTTKKPRPNSPEWWLDGNIRIEKRINGAVSNSLCESHCFCKRCLWLKYIDLKEEMGEDVSCESFPELVIPFLASLRRKVKPKKKRRSCRKCVNGCIATTGCNLFEPKNKKFYNSVWEFRATQCKNYRPVE